MQEKELVSVSEIELSQEHINRIELFRRQRETAVLVIMFTDLKGSSEIAERRGDEYARRMLYVHNQLLSEIIERNEKGIVIKTIGDAFLCVFSEPSVAVERALEMQRKLKEYNEEHPEEEDIIVRIGMHMGQVSVEDNMQTDIFGSHVNRAARVVDLTGGGHISLSQPVYENASRWLQEQDLVWQNHGEYKVKGIDEPMRIYEVADAKVTSLKAPSRKRYVPLRDRLKIPISIAATCLVVFLATFFALKHFQPMSPKRYSMAITYFENIAANVEYDWLQKGLTTMLITDLAKLKEFNVVDRGRLQEMLEQMKFGKTGIVSEATAPKVGEALGVDSILTGSYIITKPTIRIDARLISVKTNNVIAAEEIQGELDKLYQLEQQLAMKIATNLDVVPVEGQVAHVSPFAKSLDGMELYAKGLDYLDRGMSNEAREAFRQAVYKIPGYKNAKGQR